VLLIRIFPVQFANLFGFVLFSYVKIMERSNFDLQIAKFGKLNENFVKQRIN